MQRTEYRYLSGTDKNHTVVWAFFCTPGRNSGHWDKIQVPSNWELQGFDTYNYFQDIKNSGEQGLYKRQFNIENALPNRIGFTYPYRSVPVFCRCTDCQVKTLIIIS